MVGQLGLCWTCSETTKPGFFHDMAHIAETGFLKGTQFFDNYKHPFDRIMSSTNFTDFQLCHYAYGKTKVQISSAVTAQLINAFVFTS